jgi:hypothetical protein
MCIIYICDINLQCMFMHLSVSVSVSLYAISRKLPQLSIAEGLTGAKIKSRFTLPATIHAVFAPIIRPLG